MVEAGQPTDKPQRSIENTMALHGIFSALNDRMIEIGESFYSGEFETQLNHSAIFPESSCQGQMVITHADNLVQYADLICRAGCKNEVKLHPMGKPDEIMKQERDEFMVTYEAVGFLSGEFTNSEDDQGLYMRPQVLRPQLNARGLRDEDIQDLKP